MAQNTNPRENKQDAESNLQLATPGTALVGVGREGCLAVQTLWPCTRLEEREGEEDKDHRAGRVDITLRKKCTRNKPLLRYKAK